MMAEISRGREEFDYVIVRIDRDSLRGENGVTYRKTAGYVNVSGSRSR